MIESISFGSITIDGKTFSSDLIVYPDGRVIDSWWREKGHRLSRGDITALIAAEPDVIIAGTGIYGLMKPETELRDFLKDKGIEFLAAKNKDAMVLYNQRVQSQRVGACFHLTC